KPGLAEGDQIRRVPVLARSVIRTARQPNLHRRDPPQAGAPSRAAQSDSSPRTLGKSAAAAQRECGARTRKHEQVYCKSSGGKALRRRWSAAIRAGSDEVQTTLSLLCLETPRQWVRG